jgi:L-ornithine Nalpha-acyltransferase
MTECNVLARMGDLEVRLAESPHEILAVQDLRFRVFFEKGGAEPDLASARARRDICRFDEVCDHALVVDNAAPRGADGSPRVVGAYRLLCQDAAQRHFGFYSAAEFAVDALVKRHPKLRFMELGRSCVAEEYRSKRTIETLWRGVWAYALRHGIDVMFGCASLPGAEVGAHATALTLLARENGVEPDWSVAPAPHAIRAPPPDGRAFDPRAALRDLPPLIKGYLRLGARFGREAVIDHSFGTTDVFVLLRVADIEARYLDYFAPSDSSIAA